MCIIVDADDCVAAEVDGLVALEARKATPGWWTRLLGGAPTNRVEYANELEPRVGALRGSGACAPLLSGVVLATFDPVLKIVSRDPARTRGSLLAAFGDFCSGFENRE